MPAKTIATESGQDIEWGLLCRRHDHGVMRQLGKFVAPPPTCDRPTSLSRRPRVLQPALHGTVVDRPIPATPYDDETDSVMVRNDGTLPVVLLLISLGPGARPNQIPLDDGHGNLTHVNRISPIDPSPRLGVPRRPVELPTSRLLAPGEARNFPVEVIEEGAGRVSDDELRHVLTHPEIVLRDANGELWVRCEHEVVPFREPSALEIRFAFWLRRHDVFGDLWKRLVVFAAVRASTKHPRRPGLLASNWESFFSGPTWTLDEHTGEYYLHLFAKKQPDLNWENPEVREAVYAMMRWWLDRGVDGFRMDVINLISKHPGLPDGTVAEGKTNGDGFPYYSAGPRLHEYLQRSLRP